jgi:hypothetical protein
MRERRGGARAQRRFAGRGMVIERGGLWLLLLLDLHGIHAGTKLAIMRATCGGTP